MVKPAGVSIDKATLERAWQSNQDGAGFCYVNDEQTEVIIRKGFFKFKAFWKNYKKHQHKSVLIHFRWATHGEKVADNCHPFALAKDAALIHNGILSGFTPPALSKMSDTRVFCDGYLVQGLRFSGLDSHSYLESKALRGFVESLIGANNKLAVMTTKGIIIFNELQGEWHEGTWYSAGYPKVDFIYQYCTSNYPKGYDENKYFPRLQDTGLHGEDADAWLDDMMNQEERRGLKPRTGILDWDDLDDMTEEELDEQYGSNESTGESCMLCEDSEGRLYQVDGNGICGVCFEVYNRKV